MSGPNIIRSADTANVSCLTAEHPSSLPLQVGEGLPAGTTPTKRWIRKLLCRAGWELKRFDPGTSDWARLIKLLNLHQVNVVFDVGANVGQYAAKLRDSGFTGRIVSFEALAAAHCKLTEQASKDIRWTVAPRVAIGDSDGTATIHISGNSVSSSVLPMLSAHLVADPRSKYIAAEEVDLRKLDTIAAEYLSDSDRVFLKLDVQGFEHQVLRGANHFLERIAGIQLEMSLIPLYDAARSFDEMFHELFQRGFELWALAPAFIDRNTGRLLQVDGTFFRS
jgi:FkbM family methyltransferase